MPTESAFLKQSQSTPAGDYPETVYTSPSLARRPAITYKLGQSGAASDEASQIPDRLNGAIERLIAATASPSGRDWIPTTYHVFTHPGSWTDDFEATRPRFSASLKALLEEEPLEDGMTHKAEGLIRDGLTQFGAPFSHWLEDLVRDAQTSEMAVGVLRCLGRLPLAMLRGWGHALVLSCLGSPSIEVRDACVRALECWGGNDAVEALRSHRETVPWLADYVRRIIRDLERRTT